MVQDGDGDPLQCLAQDVKDDLLLYAGGLDGRAWGAAGRLRRTPPLGDDRRVKWATMESGCGFCDEAELQKVGNA